MIKHQGLRHLALNVRDVARAVDFYQRVFGMRVVWQPDPDNAYLSSGSDNLALHRGTVAERTGQSLDHLGFVVASIADLQASYQWAQENNLRFFDRSGAIVTAQSRITFAIQTAT